jgi:hypothetical protein
MKHYNKILMLHFMTTYSWSNMTLNERINTKSKIIKEFNYEYREFFNGQFSSLVTGEGK